MPTTTPIMEKLERETEADESLKALARVVHERWPSSVYDCHDTSAHWNYREKISECFRLLIKGNKIIMPKSLRKMSTSCKGKFILAQYVK